MAGSLSDFVCDVETSSPIGEKVRLHIVKCAVCTTFKTKAISGSIDVSAFALRSLELDGLARA